MSEKKINFIVNNLSTKLSRLNEYATVNKETMGEEGFKTHVREYIDCLNDRASKTQKKLDPGKGWNPKDALAAVRNLVKEEKQNFIITNVSTKLNRLRAYAKQPMDEENLKLHVREYIKCVNDRAKKIQEKIGWDKDQDWKPKDALVAAGLALSGENVGVWGSRRQYACGQTISDVLHHEKITDFKLDPVFAIMLCPVGGLAGWGNHVFYAGDMHDYVNVHAVVHDAFGYVKNFHNKGAGYNYLNTYSFFRDWMPFCCQPQGCYRARQIMQSCHKCGLNGRLERAKFIISSQKKGKTGATVEMREEAKSVIRKCNTLGKHNAGRSTSSNLGPYLSFHFISFIVLLSMTRTGAKGAGQR